MKLGIIAGNRFLPVLLAQRIKQQESNSKVVALCFKGETSREISRYVDSSHWLRVGRLSELTRILDSEGLNQCIMAGQINPLRIFQKKHWDKELLSLLEQANDFRPHTIFSKIIRRLEGKGITFLDSTSYLKNDLAENGIMNGLDLDERGQEDIKLGVKIISAFVELDVGQTIVIKQGGVVALESLEGTDRTIKRAYRLAGPGCSILKFSRARQDLRFDVPVVGISTLKLLLRIKAARLVLEKDKVIILQKDKFLSLARQWGISILGKQRLA